ncbi:Asp-tRNA(Asn)/Glu-tRNA(Gln) amidotransferase subunit GatC [Rothia amarae]|uniref:Aspartyl/glutamyl-tRNA(Asn/Gln) amidotransferase subunit C n=1 Tax=Rothia amarae TaxID=169480 RepID=A0A7H2BI96_9MICC|nr:Asp-tRNA(Asn)/Glu-tRNA(Gln) amidotransferase subunit GatC [Rothia amarae]QNV39392.1 Asp-tRNA(Asn)/Glu-tRNA(Gln) amidotransferase subunit GatC [Rothia amarae]SIL99333.1 Glutamyl-tRNA(Gln) amidotransferase subunit C (GatC) [Mycobacteroides abscessus subsp. abscessus]
MSDITRETVAHLAELAHIEMTDAELEALASELGVIVESVASVSNAVSDDIPATSHPIPLKNVFREDVVGETLTAEEALSGAPDEADGKFKVPAILEES